MVDSEPLTKFLLFILNQWLGLGFYFFFIMMLYVHPKQFYDPSSA